MEIRVGQSASITKMITEKDVIGFSEISGDSNPVHINPEAAKKSVFGRQVAHGMLVGSLFSAILGTVFPGPGTIYLEQDLKFLLPVFFNDTITATITVKEILNEKKGIYRFDTEAVNQDGKRVIEGYAVIMYR